jgi:hypothetical protein
LTKLQTIIFNALTDEPKSASRIASEIGKPTRSVSTALTWMRGNGTVDDGFGWAAYGKNGQALSSWPKEPWHSYTHPLWRRMPDEKLAALEEMHTTYRKWVAQ